MLRRGLSVSRFLARGYGGSVAPGKTRHDGPVVDFLRDYCHACRTGCEYSLSCSLAGFLDIPETETCHGPVSPGHMNEQSEILPAEFTPCFSSPHPSGQR
jgi:hypothetical protein